MERACGKEMIPQGKRHVRRHPQLITKIAGEARARDGDLFPAEGKASHSEGLQCRYVKARLGENGGGCGTLQREGCHTFCFFAHRYGETRRTIEKPGQMAFLTAEPIVVFTKAEERAIVDELAIVIAPDRVMHAAYGELCGVAHREVVEIAGGIGTRDPVFGHGAQVIERGGVADRRVFHGCVFKGKHRGIARPWAPAMGAAQG